MKPYASLIGRLLPSFACAGALLLAAGCTTPAQRHDEFSTDQPSTLALDEVLERQAMKGAAADATLNSSHFDGSALNERGRQKLNAVIQMSSGPATVYVDVADGAPDRIGSVTRYLKEAGASSQSIKIEAGPNPSNGVAAIEGLSRMKKVESSAKEGGSPQMVGAGTSNRANPSPTQVEK